MTSSTDVSVKRPADGTYNWFEETDPAIPESKRRHPCYARSTGDRRFWVCSTKVKERGGFVPLPLKKESGHHCWYDHYRVLRTHTPWRVPVMYGRMPRRPDSQSSSEDRGKYALFLMMLFRPWRRPDADVVAWAGPCALSLTCIEDFWDALFVGFLQWRREVIDKASPFFCRDNPSKPDPPFNTENWWTCMTYLRLLNMELVLSSRKSDGCAMPGTLLGLPIEEIEKPGDGDGASDVSMDDGMDAAVDTHKDEDVMGAENAEDEEPDASGSYPRVVGLRCPPLPHASELQEWLGLPQNLGRPSAEARYAGEFVARTQETCLDVSHACTADGCVRPDGRTDAEWRDWTAGALRDKASKQSAYFNALDTDKIEHTPVSKHSSHADDVAARDPFAEVRQKIKRSMDLLSVQALAKQPSHTMVVEAAVFLLGQGVLNVKGSDQMNVKQSRVLLLWAIWLQHQKSVEWIAAGKLDRRDLISLPASLRQLQMVLIGGPGTGKTTTVMVVDAFLKFFLGPEASCKSAPTNTAARMSGGDTCHALYKLPRGSLHGNRGKLSAAVLKRYRRQWENRKVHYIDEISMLQPNLFYQIEVRSRTATGTISEKFGSLATFLLGDFLQLPPVDGPSLVLPWDAVKDFFDQVDGEEKCKSSKREASKAEITPEEKKAKEQTLAEYRGGCDLWQSIEIVVSLSLNMRSGGELGRILEQMRAGRLDDEAWCSLQDRVLGVVRNEAGELRRLPEGQVDDRMLKPPFSNHRVHYILYRHVLRVSQSYINALRESSSEFRRLYVFSAIDVVKEGHEARFTEKDRMAARRIANLRRVQFLSGHLALYNGMHVLLFGKACVRLGLMNGCECRLERLILADDEREFEEMRVGVPTCLEYMPAGLLLRALDVDWTLPSYLLPTLPRRFDRRGLFVLSPSTGYFSITASDKKMLQIRRTGFTVVSASARIVYSAQGEQYDATLPDLAVPPGMQPGVHWLACYVMLSRATSLDGLLILRLATREQLSAGPPAYLREAVDRLLVLERQSAATLHTQLRAYHNVLPSEILNLFSEEAVDGEAAVFARSQADKTTLTGGNLSKRPRTGNDQEGVPYAARDGVVCQATLTPSNDGQKENMATAPGIHTSEANLAAPPLMLTRRSVASLDVTNAGAQFAKEDEAMGDARPNSSNSLSQEGLSSERVVASCPLPMLTRGCLPSLAYNNVEEHFANEEEVIGDSPIHDKGDEATDDARPDSSSSLAFDAVPVPRGECLHGPDMCAPTPSTLPPGRPLQVRRMQYHLKNTMNHDEPSLSAPTNWTFHRAHVAMLRHMARHLSETDLSEMILSKRQAWVTGLNACTSPQDFCCKTISWASCGDGACSVVGPDLSCSSGAQDTYLRISQMIPQVRMIIDTIMAKCSSS